VKPSEQLTRLTLIVRGLLAEPSGSPDMPYQPVILSISPAKEEKDSDLYIDSLAYEDGTEKIREQLRRRINDYIDKKSRRPDTICLKNLACFTVVRRAIKGGPALQNKVALVTGAAGAIGYGISKSLLENGCFLAAADLAGEKLDSFANDLEKTAPARVIGVGMDVTSESSVKEALAKVIAAWGGIDIIVVNAGIAHVANLTELTLDDFRQLERVNIEGALLTLRESAHCLINQATGGDIVIISSKNVPSPGAGFGAYSATKAACHQLGRIASLELAQYDIRVNMVAPDAVFAEGGYKSGLWHKIGPARMKARGLDEAGLEEYYRQRNLLKIKVTGRHVASAVLFFATRQTPTTGATIPVDGGLPDATPR